jgi:hypothetical protein
MLNVDNKASAVARQPVVGMTSTLIFARRSSSFHNLTGSSVLVSLGAVCNVCPNREFVLFTSTDCLKDVEIGTEEVVGRRLVINGAVDILYNAVVVNGDHQERRWVGASQCGLGIVGEGLVLSSLDPLGGVLPALWDVSSIDPDTELPSILILIVVLSICDKKYKRIP